MIIERIFPHSSARSTHDANFFAEITRSYFAVTFTRRKGGGRVPKYRTERILGFNFMLKMYTRTRIKSCKGCFAAYMVRAICLCMNQLLHGVKLLNPGTQA